MFSIGSVVVYGASGVCRVNGIVKKDFGAGERDYYVLKPTEGLNAAEIYVPADSEKLTSRMKKLLSPDEIYSLIDTALCEDAEWPSDRNARVVAFENAISCGDRSGLLRIVGSAVKQRAELGSNGKKLGTADDKYVKTAEKMLFDEFSQVISLTRDDMPKLIAGERFPTV